MTTKARIPLFPLGLVLLPHLPLPLHIFEERYKLMISECLDENKAFGVVYFNGSEVQRIGCTAVILNVLKRYGDGRLDILTRGESRFMIMEMFDEKAYLEAMVRFLDDELEEENDVCKELAKQGVNLLKQFATIAMEQQEYVFAEQMDMKSISFLISGCEGFSYEEKQQFLEMVSTRERLKKSVAALKRTIQRFKITEEIHQIIGGNGNIRRLLKNS